MAAYPILKYPDVKIPKMKPLRFFFQTPYSKIAGQFHKAPLK